MVVTDFSFFTHPVQSVDTHAKDTYVSNLLLAGVDIKTVQYLAGHEKSKTTLDIYAHLAYNKPEDTITKVRKAFGQPSAQESV